MTSPGPSLWQIGGERATDPVHGEVDADVVVIGAGFTGLWTALHLTDAEPGLRVVVLEADTVGYGASGRNGGFVEASLTHGLHNGLRHFPGEIHDLLRLAAENLQGLRAFVDEHAIDCHLEVVDLLDVAVAGWQVDDLAASVETYAQVGETTELLDAAGVRARVDSPTYLAGLVRPGGGALVDPAALARGLARVAAARGVAIHEGSRVTRLVAEGDGVRATTPEGSVRATRGVLATNAYSHRVLPRAGRWFVPVHDYVLVTEPLTTDQWARIGWEGREGIADAGNQFHYYRRTPDGRILWGGYDAVYRFGNGVGPRHDHRRATYDLLARHFRSTFPQLADVSFTHWWGGPIATTTRFTVTFGTELQGRVSWALGYTGLGVAASRFAARVLADRVRGVAGPWDDLRLTSTRPLPFPPEPFRWAGVTATRRAIANADRRDGRRGPLLRALDAVGVGFDS